MWEDAAAKWGAKRTGRGRQGEGEMTRWGRVGGCWVWKWRLRDARRGGLLSAGSGSGSEELSDTVRMLGGMTRGRYRGCKETEENKKTPGGNTV